MLFRLPEITVEPAPEIALALEVPVKVKVPALDTVLPVVVMLPTESAPPVILRES